MSNPIRTTHSEARTRAIGGDFRGFVLSRYAAISKFKYALAVPRVAKYLTVSVVPSDQVFSDALVVFAEADFGLLAILQSSFHDAWSRLYGSTLETRLRYTPTDCFETFPLPSISQIFSCTDIAEAYHSQRKSAMLGLQVGLTTLLNRVHDASETAANIACQCQLHIEMDHALAGAYGWGELDLGHGFHATAQGTRYTISEPARRGVRPGCWNSTMRSTRQRRPWGCMRRRRVKKKGQRVRTRPSGRGAVGAVLRDYNGFGQEGVECSAMQYPFLPESVVVSLTHHRRFLEVSHSFPPSQGRGFVPYWGQETWMSGL